MPHKRKSQKKNGVRWAVLSKYNGRIGIEGDDFKSFGSAASFAANLGEGHRVRKLDNTQSLESAWDYPRK